jgi:hypothetical protein
MGERERGREGERERGRVCYPIYISVYLSIEMRDSKSTSVKYFPYRVHN